MAKEDINTSEDIKLGKEAPSEPQTKPASDKQQAENESATIKNAHASGDGSLSRSEIELDDQGNAQLRK